MPSTLPEDKVHALTPLLGSLARRVALSNTQVDNSELEILLRGVDQKPETPVIAELTLWSQLLVAFQQQPSRERRQVTAEALGLRGLPEAAVHLALSAVDSYTTTSTSQTNSPTLNASLKISPPNLDFGTLQSSETGMLQMKIEGDTGTITVDSGNVRVSSTRFGPEPTLVNVEVTPVPEGLVWTSIRLTTSSGSLDVPVIAQWAAVEPISIVDFEFRNGARGHNLEDLVQFCIRFPEDALWHLRNGDVERWLVSLGFQDLAQASHSVTTTDQDDQAKLRQLVEILEATPYLREPEDERTTSSDTRSSNTSTSTAGSEQPRRLTQIVYRLARRKPGRHPAQIMLELKNDHRTKGLPSDPFWYRPQANRLKDSILATDARPLLLSGYGHFGGSYLTRWAVQQAAKQLSDHSGTKEDAVVIQITADLVGRDISSLMLRIRSWVLEIGSDQRHRDLFKRYPSIFKYFRPYDQASETSEIQRSGSLQWHTPTVGVSVKLPVGEIQVGSGSLDSGKHEAETTQTRTPRPESEQLFAVLQTLAHTLPQKPAEGLAKYSNRIRHAAIPYRIVLLLDKVDDKTQLRQLEPLLQAGGALRIISVVDRGDCDRWMEEDPRDRSWLERSFEIVRCLPIWDDSIATKFCDYYFGPDEETRQNKLYLDFVDQHLRQSGRSESGWGYMNAAYRGQFAKDASQ